MGEFRVYCEELHIGRTLGYYDSYEEAKAAFETYKPRITTAIRLQQKDPERGWYIKNLEYYEADGFADREKAYWTKLKCEELGDLSDFSFL